MSCGTQYFYAWWINHSGMVKIVDTILYGIASSIAQQSSLCDRACFARLTTHYSANATVSILAEGIAVTLSSKVRAT